MWILKPLKNQSEFWKSPGKVLEICFLKKVRTLSNAWPLLAIPINHSRKHFRRVQICQGWLTRPQSSLCSKVEEQRMMGREKGKRRRLPPSFSPYQSHLAPPFSVPISPCAVSPAWPEDDWGRVSKVDAKKEFLVNKIPTERQARMKNMPSLRPKWSKSIPVFGPKPLQNHTF